MTITTADIDALLSQPKTIFGVPAWIEEGNNAYWRADLQHDGVLIGGLSLRLTVTTHTTPQRGDGVLIFDGKPIQRFAYLPKGLHVNPKAHPIPTRLRFLSLPPDRSRIYRWRDNRAWPTPHPMAGEIFDPQPDSFNEAATMFFAECCIMGDVPAAPWRPTLL